MQPDAPSARLIITAGSDNGLVGHHSATLIAVSIASRLVEPEHALLLASLPLRSFDDSRADLHAIWPFALRKFEPQVKRDLRDSTFCIPLESLPHTVQSAALLCDA